MKKSGFTLAEVLITLVVIGIIAAITIPIVMNNVKGREYATAFKKSISAVNQVLALNYAENGEGAAKNLGNLGTMFLTHMHMDEVSTGFPGGACAGIVGQTTDGIIYCVRANNWDTTSPKCDAANTMPCAQDTEKPNVYIDVNGEKGPNQITESADAPKDQFTGMVYYSKVVPFGEAAQQIMFDN